MTAPRDPALPDPAPPDPSPGPASERESSWEPETPPTRDQLLAEVLGETLSRGRQDPEGLARAIRAWKSSLPLPSAGGSPVLDAERMAGLVGIVLRQRLGEKGDKLPEKLRQEVAEVLWNDPASRQRIQRLWASVDETP